MATPTNDSYFANSGASIYGGRGVDWPFSLPAVGVLGAISSNTLNDLTPTGGGANSADEQFSFSKLLGAWGTTALVQIKSGGIVIDVLYVIFGGGHGDTGNDGVYAWRASTGLMECLLPPLKVSLSATSDTTYGENVANRPDSQHPYSHLVGLDSDESQGPSMMQVYGAAVGQGAISAAQAHRFDALLKTWSRYGDLGTVTASIVQMIVKDVTRHRFVRFPSDAGTSYYTLDYSLSSPTWQTVSGTTARPSGWSASFEAVGIHDPVCDLYVGGIMRGTSGSKLSAISASALSGAWTELTLTGDSLPATYGTGLQYRSATDTFLLMDTSAHPPVAYFEITRPTVNPLTSAWNVVRKTFSGTSHFFNMSGANTEWFQRWQYVDFPGLGDALIAYPAGGYPMEAIKL